MIGGFIGYQINDNVGFNLNYDWEAIARYALPDKPSPDGIFQAKHISIQTLLVNAIFSPSVNWAGFAPYVNAGIGVAFNQSGAMDAFPLDKKSDFYYVINGKTTTNFAWDAGVGVDYAFKNNLHVSLGYRFVDTGTLETASSFRDILNGHVMNSMTPFKVKADQILLNEFVAGLKYSFSM